MRSAVRWDPAAWAGAAVGLAIVGFGLLLLFAPARAERLFGVPEPSRGPAMFHAVAGVREVYLGLVVAVAAVRRAYRVLGALLLSSSLIPVADLLVLSTAPGEPPLVAVVLHAASIPVVAGLGVYVLHRTRMRRE